MSENLLVVSTDASTPEVSIVMPCLNEAETIAACVTKAPASLRSRGVRGERIVSDNGSINGSQQVYVVIGYA
jgi:glycosyltransferase involved in cell wall biosynthesis